MDKAELHKAKAEALEQGLCPGDRVRARVRVRVRVRPR